MRALLLVTILLSALAPAARADLCSEPADVSCTHEQEATRHECLVFAGLYASPYVCVPDNGELDGVCHHTRVCEDVVDVVKRYIDDILA